MKACKIKRPTKRMIIDANEPFTLIIQGDGGEIRNTVYVHTIKKDKKGRYDVDLICSTHNS